MKNAKLELIIYHLHYQPSKKLKIIFIDKSYGKH